MELLLTLVTFLKFLMEIQRILYLVKIFIFLLYLMTYLINKKNYLLMELLLDLTQIH